MGASRGRAGGQGCHEKRERRKRRRTAVPWEEGEERRRAGVP